MVTYSHRAKATVLCGLVGFFAAGFFAASVATAAPLAVTLDGCGKVGADKVGERLLIELAIRSVRGPVTITIACRPETIKVCGGETDKRCRELLRARLPLQLSAAILAVTAAELLEDLAAETPEIESAAAPSPTASAAPLSTTVPHPAAARNLAIKAVAACQGFSSEAPLLWGAGLELTGDYRSHLGFSIDVLSRYGEARFSLGRVAILSVDAGAFAHVHHTLSRIVLRAGLGLRVGAVSLRGDSPDAQLTEARELWAPWAAGAAKLSLGVRLTSRLSVQAAGEVGYIFHGVVGRVDGQDAVHLAGAEASAQVGLGLTL